VVSDTQGLSEGEYQFTNDSTVAVTLHGVSAIWKKAP
jgi:hypothetical protein